MVALCVPRGRVGFKAWIIAFASPTEGTHWSEIVGSCTWPWLCTDRAFCWATPVSAHNSAPCFIQGIAVAINAVCPLLVSLSVFFSLFLSLCVWFFECFPLLWLLSPAHLPLPRCRCCCQWRCRCCCGLRCLWRSRHSLYSCDGVTKGPAFSFPAHTQHFQAYGHLFCREGLLIKAWEDR